MLAVTTERSAVRADPSRARTVEDRLVQVAELVSEQLHPMAWWLSTVDEDRALVRTQRHAIYRNPSRPAEELSAGIGNEYALADYPLTEFALRGHAVTLHAGDPDADPAELAMLDGFGAVSLLMAGVQDPSGQRWLLEIIGDAMSNNGSDLGMPLRALMTAAALESCAQD